MSAISPQAASKPAASKQPFLAFANGDSDLAALKSFAGAHNWGEDCVLSGDIRTAAEYLSNHPSPALLMVDIPSAEEAPALLDSLANVCDPGTKVVISGNVNEYSFYCWLTDIGIASYLLKPLASNALESMYQKATEPPPASGKEQREPGRVIGIIGTRGGAGATTVAIHLAGLISQNTDKKVALVDLDPQDGSVSLLLDLEPSRGLREALEKPDRIDTLFLERVMMKAGERLHILSAEESLSERITAHDQAAEALIGVLKEKFDVIILDLPRTFSTHTKNSLKICESVLVISELSLHGLRDAMRYNDFFRETLKLKNAVFIANRSGLAPKQEVPIADFEKSLGHKLAHRIPFAPDLFMETGPDFPALKHTHAAAIKTLQAIAHDIVPLTPAEGEEAVEKKSLLARFRKAKS